MMATDPSPHDDKVAFFRQLDALQCVNDDDDELQEEEERHRLQGRAFRAAMTTRHAERKPLAPIVLDDGDQGAERSAAQPGLHPRRVASAPSGGTLATTARDRVIAATPLAALKTGGSGAAKRQPLSELGASATSPLVVEETPMTIPDSTRQPLRTLRGRRSATTPLLPGKRTGPTDDSPAVGQAAKRRRQSGGRGRGGKALGITGAARKVPEAERVLDGLRFFYVPDDDVAPVRRLRITRAKDYGAQWVRRASEATHVVVDRQLEYKDVQPLLTGLRPETRVVNEDYPIDCIQFRHVLNPEQKIYHVRGAPERTSEVVPAPAADSAPVTQQPVAASVQDRVSALPLKPPQDNPKKWDYVPPRTPVTSQDGSSGDAVLLTRPLQPIESQSSSMSGSQVYPPSQQVHLEVEVSGKETSGSEANGLRDSSPVLEDGEVDPKLTTLKDDLWACIQEMKDLGDIQMDEEDDAASARGTEATSESDQESGDESRATTHTKKTGQKQIRWEDRFACNSAGSKDSRAENPNARTIEILQKMCDYYSRVDDHWRTLAYRKAISVLRRQDRKITTAEEAYKLPGIGQRLADKIEEIVTKDSLRRLEYAERDPLDDVLQLFLGIYGVGTSHARKWIAQGLRTLDDVRQKAKLSDHQRLGLEHYEDLNTQIPRREMDALGAVVRRVAAAVDPEVELVVGGSYRRGAQTSSDIDFIITKKGTNASAQLVPFQAELIRRLEAGGFIVATLASWRDRHGGGGEDGSKWHGCCVLPRADAVAALDISEDDEYRPLWRRVDFLLVPETQMGAALIYFTGDDIFNRSIRLLAAKKGMRLNQRGLYRGVMRGPGRVRATEGELVEGRDERRIFDLLGVKWREPTERWCG